eukprot:g6349.t1
MVKKKGTSAYKKKVRRKQRETERREDNGIDLKTESSNQLMECSTCHSRQRNRAFCYFCQSVQHLPMCAECGRTKCMGADCVVPHPGKHATGMRLVGAICDYCEVWICHSRKCLQTHACRCPLAEAECIVCQRGVWDHGGRLFKCATCDNWICEDDQFEHQASCQVLDSETNHCMSCNRIGIYSCLRCKVCFCGTHVKSKIGGVPKKGEVYKCKKCGYDLQETKMLSMSTRTHDYGRTTRDEASSGYYGTRSSNFYGDDEYSNDFDEEDEEDTDDDDDEEEDDDE